MIISIGKLLDKIKTGREKNKSFLVAVDGHGASGKSRISKELVQLDSQISLIHFDDFYFHDKTDLGHRTHLPKFDWQRLEREILIPIKRGENTKYQRFNWELNQLDNWIDVKSKSVVLVEGVSSMNSHIRDYFDFKIWVDCPLDVRLKRAKERDGIDSLELWKNEWMPRENNYVVSEKPYEYADLIMDGSGQKACQEKSELYMVDVQQMDTAYLGKQTK